MHNIVAIFRKQIRDTLKNKTILIQFVMYPVLTLIMNNVIKIEGMHENFFIILFSAMFVGMAPLSSIASIISEDKEQNSLRILFMSNVKSYEYLLGIGSYVWVACMIGATVICIAGGFTLTVSLYFMVIMAIGIIASILIGATIGIWSKTQMAATSLTLPVMMVLAFFPMLSMFNQTIAKISKFFYTEQLSLMLNSLNQLHLSMESLLVVAINMLIFIVLFLTAYKRCELT